MDISGDGKVREGVAPSCLPSCDLLTPATNPPPQNLQRMSALQKQVPDTSKHELSHANQYQALNLKRFG